MWSRYKNGSASPSPERINRIELKLPGTATYYSSPLWDFADDRELTSIEIFGHVQRIGKLFRNVITEVHETPGPVFWKKNYQIGGLVELALKLIDHKEHGLHALESLVFLIKDARQTQDGWLYLDLMVVISSLEIRGISHPILRVLHPDFFEFVMEPIRTIQFGDKDLNNAWAEHLQWYLKRFNGGREDFETSHSLYLWGLHVLDNENENE